MQYELKGAFDLDKLMESRNIATMLDEDDRRYIGNCALEGYTEDVQSRQKWAERSRQGMELALQVMTQKTEPWEGCSNVKFPLITVAALQYQALAYPAIIDAPEVVKCAVYGEDKDGQKTARAERISAHMSWQNLEQDTGWEEAHDKGLLVQAIAGDAFIKKAFDPACRHTVTQLVLPDNFVINYYSRDIATSPRYTHTYNLSRNDIRQRELDERFIPPLPDRGGGEPEQAPEQTPNSQLVEAKNERQGITQPQVSSATPYFTGEQYCWWDLDGDGYDEPYIVTFDIATGNVRRIVARFLPSGVRYLGAKVYDIQPVQVFTQIPFIPSPDGGFYNIGLGQLLGGITESANTAINQIFDAGTMATLGGGFLGRGFKNRAGPFSFKPFQWYPIDAPGDDLHKNILPLPVREPSAVLLQVFTFLVQYAERITQANEIQAGESPGQNTPAETTRTLDQNGRRMVNAIFKRTWRAFRAEYRIQYSINAKFLPVSEDYQNLVTGAGAMILATDYQGVNLDVKPAADPYIVSDTQRSQQSMQLVQMANSLPGFNRYQTTRRALKAMKVSNIEEIYPQPMGQDGKPAPDFQPPPDPKMLEIQIKQQQLQLDAQQMQGEQQEAKMKLMLMVQEIGAKIVNLQAQAQLYEAQAKSAESEPIIKLIYAQIETQASQRDAMLRMIENFSNLHVEHKKIALDAKEKGINLPGAVSPSDAIAQTNGAMLGSLQ